MRIIIRKLSSANTQPEIFSYSKIKFYRRNVKNTEQTNLASTTNNNHQTQNQSDSELNEYRENEMKIQMLSRNLYKQIFSNSSKSTSQINPKLIEKCHSNMKKCGIKIGESPKLEDIILKLPNLKGKTIEEHFYNIGKEQCQPYFELIDSVLIDTPPMPKEWSMNPGWTCYYDVNKCKSVPFPEDNVFVFDIEVCMTAGQGPTLACAVSNKHWYSWVSPQLLSPSTSNTNLTTEFRKYTIDDMIPFGNSSTSKLIVGHNVSFDRARIREQYLIENTNVRFLDTMSLHVCVSGITSYQRAMLKSNKEFDEEDLEWSSKSSLNSLAEVYRLYCEKELKKEPREIFIKGTLDEVRDNFQYLMNYCAGDVHATHGVLRKIYPLFKERFPHPVTLAGMLEIGSAYLPINSNWNRYIEESNLTYEDLDIESRYHLSKKADEACELMEDEKYKKDLWMWDQDWSTQELKLKKTATKNSKNKDTDNVITENAEVDPLEQKFRHLYETKKLLPVRRPLLPGYPAWYRKLCLKPSDEDWSPGANNIGTGMQVSPKLLNLCWEGYPLHYLKEYGWGFLVPFQTSSSYGDDGKIPLDELVKKCPVVETDAEAGSKESEDALNTLWKDVESNLSKKDYYRKAKKDKTEGKYNGTGVWCNMILEECCWFLKLPHKNGISHRVGNPLAKDFLNKFSENVLSGDGGHSAERVIQIARMLSYWRNNRDRIMGQLAVWIPKENLPRALRNSDTEYGAIIPQVVVCGTLTRRAMEPTWMTASNAQEERVGSELRAMVQAPKGYKIVGADVDSQELWIASVLGDASATEMHGATPLGWMTLSGTKSSGTDMHSVTAKAVGISRDHAKVINYARIYGAGQNFAERLLKQFNPTISDGEARSKAMKMFSLTKGKKVYYLLPEFNQEYPDKGYSGYEALKIAAANGKSVMEMFKKPQWEGGTESAMFNRLEEIAEKEQPTTPFLNGRLSRALEPKQGNDDRFLPTRINWVVQSGAVDFLHLMLVSMRWLMGSNVKFCLSFHDEIRYLVKEELAYKTALAMHVTNLLTRSFCVSRIGLNDLPQSVAFFSSVEVDTVLRKESGHDCKTPSNSHGLEAGYGISKGESLNIYETLQKVGNNNMTKWEWHLKKPRKKVNVKDTRKVEIK